MRDGETVAVAVEDRSQVGAARRVAMSVAAEAGLGESVRSDVGIVATEAATNIVLHAGKGELLVRRLEGARGPGVELLCVDRGPGMPDVEACLQDGVSGKGTMGNGFGAMRRLANAFSIFSAPGKGTALVCRFWSRSSAAGNGNAPAVSGLAVPVRGETACGDAWTTVDATTGTAIMLADGLGHGPLAADASHAAVRIFREQAAIHPGRAIDLMHAGLRSTRGAAVSVAVVDRHRREIRYAGIGNISGAIVSEQGMRSLVSHNGTVGHQIRKVQEFVYPWSHGALLVLHSDGARHALEAGSVPRSVSRGSRHHRRHSVSRSRPPAGRLERRRMPSHRGGGGMNTPLLRIQLRRGEDVVLARRRTRQIAEHLGFDGQDQVRLATVVSELARNAVQYALGGWIQFELVTDGEPHLLIRVEDHGPGIPHLDQILDGRYQSTTGLGIGLIGARRFTDRFAIDTTPDQGTSVQVGKLLPPGRVLKPVSVAELTRTLAAVRADDSLDELEIRNQELVRALVTLAEQQAETERLNAELAETNRGVLALYAELDDRAAELARVSQLKSAFLSGITHELRTPLNSILNMTRILLGRMDGELTGEQDIQVNLIQKAAITLTDMVADLLDLARIEAGKTEIRLVAFTVSDIFGSAPRHVPAAAHVGCGLARLRDAGARDDPHDRRGQAVADPPQPDLQRDQVHRAGRDQGLGGGGTGGHRGLLP